MNYKIQAHPFHLVEPSPWPLTCSIGLGIMGMGGVILFNGLGISVLVIGLIITIITCTLWFRDCIREGSYQGYHTKKVRKGLNIGFILFVVSEVCFFFSVFWSYFHSSLSPAVELGSMWPPMGIEVLNPWELPLLNTIILLSSGVSLKCSELNNLIIYSVLPISSPKTPSLKRIGPHNIDILSILIGSLLGDGSMEKDGKGYRVCFYQEKSHGEYLLWLHKTLFCLGYCRQDIPKITVRKALEENQLRYIYRFRTYTYSSFNWIYDSFYRTTLTKEVISRVKRVPACIDKYLTPLALAVWIMDDGCLIKNRGLKISTNSFTLKEVKYLSSIISKKYGINSSFIKTGKINQYEIYFPKSTLPKLIKIVKPHIHPTMYYKIGIIE